MGEISGMGAVSTSRPSYKDIFAVSWCCGALQKEARQSMTFDLHNTSSNQRRWPAPLTRQTLDSLSHSPPIICPRRSYSDSVEPPIYSQLENSRQSSHCPTPLKPCCLCQHVSSSVSSGAPPTPVLVASPPYSLPSATSLLYIRSTHQPIATSLSSAPMPSISNPTPSSQPASYPPTPHPLIHLMIHHLIQE